MTAWDDATTSGPATSLLGRVSRGEVLGLLPRGAAERGYALYQERRVNLLRWTGRELEAELANPAVTVQVAEQENGCSFSTLCSACGEVAALCLHGAAALLQWLDIRPTMQRMGPGSAWRAHSRHPFVGPARSTGERLDLSHLVGDDLRSALELQLSLHRANTATARLAGHDVEILITLPSGETRSLVFAASVLPSALPLLHSLPRLKLEGELGGLELSEARLRPVLLADWNDHGILLEPAYQLTDGTTVAVASLADRIHGRWAQLGSYLCRLLDPPTPLVPFHRKGRQLLSGREALRFLNLDHPQLQQQPWYQPTGHLAGFRRPLLPRPVSLAADLTAGGKIRLRPRFAAGERELRWEAALDLISTGFVRLGPEIVRAPDLRLFTDAGFRQPARGARRGLVGSRLDLIRLIAASGLPVVAGSAELRQLSDVLLGRDLPEIDDPSGLRSRLRPYQHEGLRWLWSRYQAGVGALLADDMGLGKTHQILALLLAVRGLRPTARFLVVCPRGVLEHWSDLLARFAPELDTQIFHGPDRSLPSEDRGAAVTLTTYDILLRSTTQLSDRTWEVAVFDEAQRIKNPRTKAARAARRVPARFRVALSGTPLENRLIELWSVIDLIVPGFLGSEREFRDAFRSPSQHQLHRLRRRLGVLTLRRLKEHVLSDLPDKVEDTRYCRLADDQAEVYRAVHAHQGELIAERLRDAGGEIPYLHIFAFLTMLKQVCDHPSLVDPTLARAGSGKLEVLDEILDEAGAGDHQVVVFSQYVRMIRFLSRHLAARGIDHLTLTGSTNDRDRVIRRFNSGQHERVLLASLLAGGVGIDLTGASVVVHYDRWWNPAKENQATDRVHRIGQKRFVHVVKLVARDTIEERIDAMIQRKSELLDSIVPPTDEVVRGLDRRELAELLGLDPAVLSAG